MLHASRSGCALLALSLLAPAALAAGDVWVVRGAGAHFQSIQPAVNAAAAGDVILVRSGVDATVSVKGKGVWIVEDDGATAVVTQRFVVRDLPLGQSVVLSGLELAGDHSAALTLRSNAGSVRLQGIKVTGAGGFNPYPAPSNAHADGWPAVYVTASDDVALVQCTLQGGHGGSVFDWWKQFGTGDGGPAIEARYSRLALYQCSVSAGSGGDMYDVHEWDGGDGGDGIDVLSSELFLSACFLQGGAGGRGGDGGAFSYSGGCGGRGGDGLEATQPATVVRELGGSAAGGSGGPAGYPINYCPWQGADGLPRRLGGGANHVPVPGTPRGFTLDPLVREGQVSNFAWTGEVGDRCQLRAAPLGKFESSGASVGPALTQAPPFATARGLVVAGTGGSAQFPFSIAELGPGVDVRTSLVQGLALSSAPPGAWLSASWGLVVLDSAF